MRGYHYILTSAYNINDQKNFTLYLSELEEYRQTNYKKFNSNTQITSFLYVHSGRLTHFFMTGDFEKGLSVIPKTTRRLNRYKDKLDVHRVMVFYYKIAWMYLGAEKTEQSLKYLNKIMILSVGSLREDIQCYTRLMHLMAHYDQKNYHIIDYLVTGAESFFRKMKTLNKLQEDTLIFFKNIRKAPLNDRRELFRKFLDDLDKILLDKYESKALLYLDIHSWVKAKVIGASLSSVTKKKNRSHV